MEARLFDLIFELGRLINELISILSTTRRGYAYPRGLDVIPLRPHVELSEKRAN